MTLLAKIKSSLPSSWQKIIGALVPLLQALPLFIKILGLSLVAHFFLLLIFRAWVIHSEPTPRFPQTRFYVVDLPLDKTASTNPTAFERFYRVPTESVPATPSSPAQAKIQAEPETPKLSPMDANASLFERHAQATQGRLRFFNWKAPKNEGSTVFVIDISGSMLQHSGSSTRLVQAYDELKKALAALTPGQQFNIVLFAETVNPFSAQPVPATRENILRAYRYLDSSIDCGGSTNLQNALRLVVAMKPNTVVLLTDGLPTSSEPRSILSEAKYLREKSGQQTDIHAVGFHLESGSEEELFLKKLTKESNGTYVRWNP
jgi:hypothetical protein